MIDQSTLVKPMEPTSQSTPATVLPVHTQDWQPANPASRKADDILTAAIERALDRADVMTSRYFNDFVLQVHDGIVLLRGHVLRPSSKKQIELIAGQTPGVMRVDNQLVADTDLESNVAQALSAVTSQSHDRLFVNARQGIIDLSGNASSTAVRDAAEQCAANVSYVRAVVNRIEAPNTNDPAPTRLVQPRVGQAVIAQDTSLGTVETVIINPRNRRVSAFILRGKFPIAGPMNRDALRGDGPTLARTIVIPASAIQNVNRHDVMLTMTGEQAAQCADFDAAQFTPMDPKWLPPYPYQTGEVLVELPKQSAA